MTVRELIEALARLDPSAKVVSNGDTYSDGSPFFEEVEVVRVNTKKKVWMGLEVGVVVLEGQQQ
ncbi:MAG: hypothetical protein QG615_1753 [Nitrospirota bacterium]|nr:hypothetical protein [Nitrospirota bacterium]